MKQVNNTVFALISQVMPKVSATVLFILLARSAGKAEAGAYSLATTYLTILVLLSAFGLDEVIVREVAKERSLARTYFRNFLALRGLLSIAGYLLLWVGIKAFFRYNPSIEFTILLLGLTLLPESLTDIAQGLLMATGHIRWMALSSSIISVSQFVTGALVIWLDPRLQSLLIVLVIHSFLGCALNLGLALIPLRSLPDGSIGNAHTSQSERPGELSFQLWKRQIALAPAFIAINTFSVLEMQMDVALLSASRSIEEVGLYGAAKTLIASFAILSQAFRIAIYPRLAKLYPAALDATRELYHRMFRYLAVIAFPMAALIAIEAPLIVHLLYKSGFRQAVMPLQILTVALLVGFIYIPATRLMIAGHREKQLAKLLFVSFGVNLLANLVMIRAWGATGSAVARALSTLVYFALCDLYVNRMILRTETLSVVARVMICTGTMIGVILLLRPYSPFLAILAGLVIYAALVIRLRCVDVNHLRALVHEYWAQRPLGPRTG